MSIEAQAAKTAPEPPPVTDETRPSLNPATHLDYKLISHIATLWESRNMSTRYMEVQCDLIGYIRQESLSSPENLFTVTGSDHHFNAATCSEYVSTAFPRLNGVRILRFCFDTVRCFLEEPYDDSYIGTPPSSVKGFYDGAFYRQWAGSIPAVYDGVFDRQWADSNSAVHIRINRNKPNTMLLKISGYRAVTKMIAQLIAWMICTFRTTPNRFDLITLSGAEVYQTSNPAIFMGLRLKDSWNNDYSGMCWYALLKGALIAYGFPARNAVPETSSGMTQLTQELPTAIEESNNEPVQLRGVEMSFDCMISLAGTQYPLRFHNGYVFKGYHTLLVPVGVNKENVQWHLYSTYGAETIPKHLESVLSEHSLGRRPFARGIDWTVIRSLRHFVGYSPEACLHLGTSDGDYEPYEDSGATVEKPSLQSEGLNLSFGTEGMGVFVSCFQDLILNRCKISAVLGPNLGACKAFCDSVPMLSYKRFTRQLQGEQYRHLRSLFYESSSQRRSLLRNFAVEACKNCY